MVWSFEKKGERKEGREGTKDEGTAYLDVPIREPGSGDQGSVSNAHPVVNLSRGREGRKERRAEGKKERVISVKGMSTCPPCPPSFPPSLFLSSFPPSLPPSLLSTSYFSFRPRKMEIVSSSPGSVTSTDWKRRARAASFSMCFLHGYGKKKTERETERERETRGR